MSRTFDADSSSFLILDIARMLRTEFERRVAESELAVTPGEARALFTIARFGPLRQNDLADLSGLGAMSVSAFLDRLEAAGLVLRRADPQDRRAKLVQVAETAAPLLTRLEELGAEIHAISRGDMNQAEWEQLCKLLLRARDNHLAARRGETGKDGS